MEFRKTSNKSLSLFILLPSAFRGVIVELDINGKKIWVKEDETLNAHYESVQKGEWEPDTFHIFDAFLDENHSYFDIGAWIGVTSLYGSSIAKKCYAFEPDPIACEKFIDNLTLNPKLSDKINLSRCAISHNIGEAVLGSITSEVGGDSNSSLLFKKGRVNWTVKTTTLQAFIQDNSISDFNFIKMDIEGAERYVLPFMSTFLETYKPTLFVALHPLYYGPDFPKVARDLIQVLKSYKHVFISHGEELELSSLQRIRAFYEIVATDTPIEALKDGVWKKKIKLL